MAIINRTWGFVFVHIPKNGGTSVSSALEPLNNWSDVQLGGTEFGESVNAPYRQKFGIHKHSFGSELMNTIGQEDWSRMTTFSVVRNPISRTVSTFQYLRHHRDHYSFMQDIDCLSDFVSSEHWQGDGPDRMFVPQWHWIRRGANRATSIVDRILRLEQLEDDFPKLLADLSIPPAKRQKISLSRKNVSPPQDGANLNDGVLERIVSRYAVDFEQLGYAQELGSECRMFGSSARTPNTEGGS